MLGKVLESPRGALLRKLPELELQYGTATTRCLLGVGVDEVARPTVFRRSCALDNRGQAVAVLAHVV